MRVFPAYRLPTGASPSLRDGVVYRRDETEARTDGPQATAATFEELAATPVSDDLTLAYPSLTPCLVRSLCDHLVQAGTRLHDRPTTALAESLGRAGARFLDPADPVRRAALTYLPAAAGISSAMARQVLDGMARDWTTPRLLELVRAQFPDPRVLDGFRPGPRGSRQRALGYPLLVQWGAGNVAGVSVGGMMRALITRSPVFLKPGLHDAVLPVLYARALQECDPELGAALAVLYWPGGAGAAEAEVLARAGVVVVYGGDEAVAGVRARLPAATPLVMHPHRVSVGVVGRAALAGERAAETARAAAGAVAAFDQRGCVSPHLFWVEEGGGVAPTDWAAELASALEAAEATHPAGPPARATAAQVHQLRGSWELMEAAGTGARVFSSAGPEWTVVYDPDPAFTPSCLGRFAWVKPVADLGRVPALMERVRSFLQTVALTGAGARASALAERLVRAGARRITTFERMPWPPAWGHHDGGDPLRVLVRWADWEDHETQRHTSDC